MRVQDVLTQARDAMTVKRVFGEPYQQGQLTIIPVAAVAGGAGGSMGAEAGQEAKGAGGVGFGLNARPAGVYVITGDTVRWQPALDVNRVILGGQVVAIVFFLVIRAIVARRREGR